ncbi:hypothetical protein JHK82_025268 [Glycine max]|uniref:Uncharacterized protein n=1 Tax=Glycine max TaxID=3847 RepID=K7LE43_SOYBN|nr:hypothetical protein JHK85_025893 [Glycine max]KAG5134080.1 hypothetical protein JHK82_025268 [Glycine max]KAH1043168.1 hypothetical protein GYH30_025153 [Glycine max]
MIKTLSIFTSSSSIFSLFNYCFKSLLGEIRQLLREAPLEESRKRELSSALHVYFKDWLYGNYHLLSFRSNL